LSKTRLCKWDKEEYCADRPGKSLFHMMITCDAYIQALYVEAVCQT